MNDKDVQAELISEDRINELHEVLAQIGFMGAAETITRVCKAGEGNMNCTLRVTTNQRSFVVKQSRPWVEKYPSIPAPMDRALHEIRFYQATKRIDGVSSKIPQLLATDESRHLLVLQDLGAGQDGSTFYDSHQEKLTERVPELARWSAALHSQDPSNLASPDFRNGELRKLNHAHIFEIPFHYPSMIDLDSISAGLDSLAKRVSTHHTLIAKAKELGDAYLKDGNCLIHGDFFPGSWLFTDEGLFVIDPEFCHLGRSEFDLGVCVAHLKIAGIDAPKSILTEYESNGGHFDQRLTMAWSGIEVIRRLLGVAQLPIDRTLEERAELLAWAEQQCLC